MNNRVDENFVTLAGLKHASMSDDPVTYSLLLRSHFPVEREEG